MTRRLGISAHPCRSRTTRRRRRESGVSLIELLISMALLAAVAIGILPMIMRSLADRNRGWEATAGSHAVASRIEPLLAIPYESAPMTIDAGTTEKLAADYWVEGDPDVVGDAEEGWTADNTSAGANRTLWTRNTWVRWYNSDDLSTPLDGNADSSTVNLKEIQVQLTSERQGGSLGAGQEIWIRVLKAF